MLLSLMSHSVCCCCCCCCSWWLAGLVHAVLQHNKNGTNSIRRKGPKIPCRWPDKMKQINGLFCSSQKPPSATPPRLVPSSGRQVAPPSPIIIRGTKFIPRRLIHFTTNLTEDALCRCNEESRYGRQQKKGRRQWAWPGPLLPP